MTKNLKLSYIFMFIFSAILIAWHTLSNFFGGVAINFVAILGIVFAILFMQFSDKDLMKRIRDLFIIACIFCFLELIIYFACEFGYGEYLKGFVVYQNILSFFGIIFLTYVCFRFTAEYLNKRYTFIEMILGNVKHQPKKKEKKAKELSNGSLLDKPNNKLSNEIKPEIIENNLNSNDENTENLTTENEIIIETEE